MINALNKPSDEKNYADAAAQFAYRAYGFSGDQYNYIVSSIDKQFMEIIKMEMMYQEFIAQRGDYFEEKYPDDESKWESYAAWTNDLNKLNEDVAKAMDTMLDREILVSDSTVGSIRMKLDEFVKPEDMVSVRMKNENYHEKLTGEFYENEQPIIDAFNEGYLYDIIFHAAGGSGLGVFAAAQESDFIAIGANSNQNIIDPDHIVASMLKRVDVAAYDIVKAALEGDLQVGSEKVLGLEDEGIGYTLDGSNIKVPEDVVEKLEEIKEKIITGEIQVPVEL